MALEFELVLADHHPFSAGEIMIVEGSYGREQLGGGRKSSKWDVATETFPTAAEAAQFAHERGIVPNLPYGYPETIELCDAATSLLHAIEESDAGRVEVSQSHQTQKDEK